LVSLNEKEMRSVGMSAVVLALSFFLFACNNGNEGSAAHLEVHLTDAPGDYQQVNIDVQDVQVNVSSSDDNGWTSLDVKEGVYDLLKLTNGLDTLLGKIDLPPGKVAQIRLILGTNNSIRVHDQLIPLSTPSAQQSGLKIQVHQDLVEGVTYKILLDFDAARSIVSAGASGKYNLKPVIRSIVEAESGAIKGSISPVAAAPVIYAVSGMDTTATDFADPVTGNFLIKGLSATTYKIIITPKAGYQVAVKENVVVTTGNLTDLGAITVVQ